MVPERWPVSWEEGVAELRDRTGQPGPSTWSGGTFPSGQDESRRRGQWYEAAAYARFAKMQLPTSAPLVARRDEQQPGSLWMYIRSSNMNGTGVRRAGQGR